ncbi:hypothetical protein AcV5_009722 [Taiwanofungus camphoratus]|nr:hypothetical protein AcV5_009722 [Antrodia cinnamomea]
MPTYRGLEVSIVSEGVDLEEYNVRVHGGKIVTAHIESEAGKEFVYEYCNSLQTTIAIETTIDGSRIPSIIHCQPGMTGYDVGHCITRHEVRPYKFAEIAVTSDQPNEDGASSIGVIELRMFRVKNVTFASDLEESESETEFEPIDGHTPGDSRRRHHIALGKSRDVLDDHPWERPIKECDYLDKRDNPFVIFRFLYRPREMLERLIGKTSGPTPSRAAPSRKQKPRKGDRDRQREPTSKDLPPRKAKSHPRRSARLLQSRASPIQPQDAPQPKPNLEPEQGRISASGKCPNREARVKEEHGSHPKDPAPLEDVLCTSSDNSDDLREKLSVAEAQVTILKYQLKKQKRRAEVDKSARVKRRKHGQASIIDLTSD